MHACIEAHKSGNADADDLVDAIATAAGKNDAFENAFKSFLNQNGVPRVSTKLDCEPNSAATLKLTQRRYLALGSTGDPNRL